MGEYNPLRGYIVEEAKRHILTVSDDPARRVGGKRYGADKLRQVFSEACELPPAWTPQNLQALETPGMWLAKSGRGGTTESEKAIHWCGIFATFVLRRVGLDVKWRAGDGIVSTRGGVKYLARKHSWIPKDGFDRKAFEPGDVCVIPRANHHFIVVEAPPGSDTLRCIAGNGSKQQIEWQDHSRQSIVTHYSLVWDPFASRL
jgi:hypothetical protein